MAADTHEVEKGRMLGLRAAARKARATAKAVVNHEASFLLEAHANWCEREARKLEKVKEGRKP